MYERCLEGNHVVQDGQARVRRVGDNLYEADLVCMKCKATVTARLELSPYLWRLNDAA